MGNPFPFRLNAPGRSAALLRAQQGVVYIVADRSVETPRQARAGERLQRDFRQPMTYTHVLNRGGRAVYSPAARL